MRRVGAFLILFLLLAALLHADDLDMGDDSIVNVGGVLFGAEGEVADDQIRFSNDPGSIDFDGNGAVTADNALAIEAPELALVGSDSFTVGSGGATAAIIGNTEEGENEFLALFGSGLMVFAGYEQAAVTSKVIMEYARDSLVLMVDPTVFAPEGEGEGEGESEGELRHVGGVYSDLASGSMGPGLPPVMLFASQEDIGVVSGTMWFEDGSPSMVQTGARLVAEASGDALLSSDDGGAVTCKADGDVIVRLGPPSGGGEGEQDSGGQEDGGQDDMPLRFPTLQPRLYRQILGK